MLLLGPGLVAQPVAPPAEPAAGGAAADQTLATARELTLLRAEVRNQQEMVGLLRQRLTESEATNALVPWLSLAVLALAGAALLVWRRGRVGSAGKVPVAAAPAARGKRRRSGQGDDFEDSTGPATVFAAPYPGLLQQAPSTRAAKIDTRLLDPEQAPLPPAPTPAPVAAHGAPSPAASALAALGELTQPAAHERLVPRSTFAGDAAADGIGLGGLTMPRPGAGLGMGLGSGLAAVPATPSPTQDVNEDGVGAVPAPLSSPAQRPEPAARIGEMTMAIGAAPRAMSVEELFDLEQQVDFFLALDQTESAVDLLVSHIRGTGGNSALPYIKLMEVYRQQGDHESHERTRKRFNQRFNAHAPAWSDDPRAGRSLEQYPEVVIRLQRVWASPLDALAELESLLYRRSRGELFDLPAFRDVLVLHGMAVDLHEHSPAATTRVDILLPLGEDLPGNTVPEPHLSAHPHGPLHGLPRADRPSLADLPAAPLAPLAMGGLMAAGAASAAAATSAPPARSLLEEWSSLDSGHAPPDLAGPGQPAASTPAALDFMALYSQSDQDGGLPPLPPLPAFAGGLQGVRELDLDALPDLPPVRHGRLPGASTH